MVIIWRTTAKEKTMSKQIKYEIPEGTRPAPCKGCKAWIYWVKTKNGKNMPVDEDGTPHWATCTKAKDFKR